MKSKEGNGEWWYAFKVYDKAGILPSVFVDMSQKEKAILIAWHDMIDEEIQKERKKR